MKLPAPFYAWDEHYGIDLPGARALFTTRRGGFSEGPYASLNLGRLTDDRPEAVQRNRARSRQAGVPPALIRQVHGTSVRTISGMTDVGRRAAARRRTSSCPRPTARRRALRGVAPMVLAADCLPIAIAGRGSRRRRRGAVAMLHAGWRGLAGGIVAEGVRARPRARGRRTARGGDRSRRRRVLLRGGRGGARAVRRATASACAAGGNLDLKAIARDQLERAGVAAVHDVGLCTICSDESLFFSHRRDHGVTGRQAGIVWLS